MKTEEEITEEIDKWWRYALDGNPEEVDYGPDMPRGVISAGLESQYRSPQIWNAPEPRKDATREDYMRVEPIYLKRCESHRKRICYYASHPAKPVARNDVEVIKAFRSDVAAI